MRFSFLVKLKLYLLFNGSLVNPESIKCILILAEAEAINLNSHYLALKWFQTLAKITRLHGSLHTKPSKIIEVGLKIC